MAKAKKNSKSTSKKTASEKYSGKVAKDAVDQGVIDFLKGFADDVIALYSIDQIAKATGLSKASVNHMRLYSKGSAATWVRLFAFAFKIPLADLSAFTKKQLGNSEDKARGGPVEQLIEKAREKYGEQELQAWLKLLLAKYTIDMEIKNGR